MDNPKPQYSVLQRVSVAASWFGGAIILVCAIAISTDVITRNLFNASYLQSFELSQYGFAIAVAFGMSAGVIGRDHIRIDVLANVLPGKLRRVLHLVSSISLVIMSILFCYFAIELALDSFSRGSRSATSLRIYSWIPQSIWAFGLCVFVIVSVWTLIKSVKCLLTRDYKSCDSLIGFQGDLDH